MSETVYWDQSSFPALQDRPLYLACTDRGLCRITWPHETFDTLRDWVDKRMPGAALVRDEGRLSPYVRQLREYFQGERQSFEASYDLRGTEFQRSVWEALSRIPYGEVRSYSEIAEAAGKPAAVRAAGMSIGANPVPILIPCHRVIGKNAALTGFRGGLQAKETLLTLEGFRGYRAKGHERFRF